MKPKTEQIPAFAIELPRSSGLARPTAVTVRARVEREVGERFLGDAEARCLDVRREPRVRRADGQIQPIAGALRMLLEQMAEGGNQPEVVEHRGPKVEREGLHFRDRLVDHVNALVQQLRRRLGTDAPARFFQIHPDGGEVLADLVVQLARE
jgi:hypothetical protein